MDRISILLLTGSIRMVVESISSYLKICNEKVANRLYIKFEPDLSYPVEKSNVSSLKKLSEFVPLVYNKASLLCQNLDVRVLLSNSKSMKKEYNLVLVNDVENESIVSSYVHNHLGGNYDIFVKIPVKNSSELEKPEETQSSEDFEVYETVCLGGTFDRLHNGHKVLLSEAALRATKKLIVGVTDVSMLKKKTLWELIQPVERRISDVREFLNDVDPSLHYEVVPITDPYGPTISNPDIDCIVVSSETKAGGGRVNSERKKLGMSELSMHVVDLVENPEDIPGEEKKLSSSNMRMRLLGTCLKSPREPLNSLYTIHLQGCPFTGKSCIAHYFGKEGGAVINCRDIIQSILRKENEIQDFVVCVGESVTKEGCIDYEKLLRVCLLDEEKRKWTAKFLNKKVEEEIKQTIQKLRTEGKKHVLVQDSLLLDLKLESDMNETWSTILPVLEVESRLQKNYDLSSENAKRVLLSLPGNTEYLEKSHRVFCTLWSDEVTEQQVLKAWSDLRVFGSSKI